MYIKVYSKSTNFIFLRNREKYFSSEKISFLELLTNEMS